jgi:hypothetical protein
VSESHDGDGRIDFGTDVDGAVRYWNGYADFADGVSQVRRVLAVMEPVLGAVASCYVLKSGRYVAVRMENLPSTNAVTINVGYVYVTFAARSAANAAGVDLAALLRDDGLDLDDGDEDGKTVWNAQGRRGIARGTQDETPRRLCPKCFLQWRGDTCPDCDVELMPLRQEP